MNYTGIFTYNFSHLITTAPNLTMAIILSITFVVMIVLLRYIFLFFVGVFLLYEDKKKIKNRQKTLNDLILMKDIQTELEKEIEQATLKTAFQN